MKKIIYLFFALLLVFSASAGEIKELNISKGETQTIDFKVKDGVEIDMLGGRHIININKIQKDGADLDVWTFVDGDQKTMYVTVNRKQLVKLDFDRDGRGEIYISLNKFYKYDDTDGKRADGVSLDFFYPSDDDFDTNQITGDVVADVEEQGSNWFGGIGLLIVLIIGVIVVVTAAAFFFDKKRGEKEK